MSSAAKGRVTHGQILTALLIPVGAVALLLAGIWFFQRSLIYFPDRRAVPPAAAILPRAEEVVLRTEDGLRLGGWFVPAEGDAGTMAVLVCNGNAGNRADRAPLAAALARAGISVLLFDYRGYGGNPGSPSESGLLADARAAHAYLTGRAGVDPQRIAYFGESIGAAVAAQLALERRPAALVLRSPFTALADVGRLHYPFLPVDLLLVDRYPTAQRIGRLSVPVLVIAGEQDRIVPFEQSRRLYEAAPEPKRLLVIPGADHNDFELFAGGQLVAEVTRFLRETVPRSGPSS